MLLLVGDEMMVENIFIEFPFARIIQNKKKMVLH